MYLNFPSQSLLLAANAVRMSHEAKVKAQSGRASPKTVSSELASPATSSCFVHFYLGLQISFTLHGISICTKYIGEAEEGRSPPQLALKLADYKDFNQRMPL